MWGSEGPDLPDEARMVLVLAQSSPGVCAALSGRGGRVLLVRYTNVTETDLVERLEDRFEDPPPVRALGVGDDVEPSDLTGQGIAIAEALSPETVVCVDSLGALLQYVDREQAFQFVHTLGERCAESSSAMHFHLDPAAVDERTVATLSLPMDAVVDVDGGDVTVRPELTETD
jgi:hypothetical protein